MSRRRAPQLHFREMSSRVNSILKWPAYGTTSSSTTSSSLKSLHQVHICGTHVLPQLHHFCDTFRAELADEGPCKASIGGRRLRLQELQKEDAQAQKIRSELGKVGWEDSEGVLHYQGLPYVPEITRAHLTPLRFSELNSLADIMMRCLKGTLVSDDCSRWRIRIYLTRSFSSTSGLLDGIVWDKAWVAPLALPWRSSIRKWYRESSCVSHGIFTLILWTQGVPDNLLPQYQHNGQCHCGSRSIGSITYASFGASKMKSRIKAITQLLHRPTIWSSTPKNLAKPYFALWWGEKLHALKPADTSTCRRQRWSLWETRFEREEQHQPNIRRPDEGMRSEMRYQSEWHGVF